MANPTIRRLCFGHRLEQPLRHDVLDADQVRVLRVAIERIGLLGGMSWESSAAYSRLVSEAVRRRLGGLHSADCLLRSVDFPEIEALQRAGDWDGAGRRLASEASQRGCTEIGLLVGDRDASVPVFDTTRLHAEAAVSVAMA